MTNLLLAKMGVGRLPTFDYASISDPETLALVQAATSKVKALQQAAILDVGRELLAVKKALPHGSFLEWIEVEFGWTGRTAQNYMSVAERLGAKYETVSHLAPTALYKLASKSTPDEVRDAVLSLKPGQTVTAKGIQFAIDGEKRLAVFRDRRARREELRQQEEKRRAGLRDRLEAEAREVDERKALAAEAAERVRDLVGDRFPELADILEPVDRFMFGEALVRLALKTRYTTANGHDRMAESAH